MARRPAERPPALRYEAHDSESSRIREKLAGKPYVVIHPGSVMATKRWEAERFAAGCEEPYWSGISRSSSTAGPGEESYAVAPLKKSTVHR